MIVVAPVRCTPTVQVSSDNVVLIEMGITVQTTNPDAGQLYVDQLWFDSVVPSRETVFLLSWVFTYP